MKSVTRMIMMSIIALTLLTAGSVMRAQSVAPKRFTVPFAFQAGDHLLPPGTYRFIPITGQPMTYRLLEDNSTTQVLVTADGGEKIAPRTLESDKVVFERDETMNRYVMTQVWDAANGAAVQMSGTYPLTRAARAQERAHPDVKVIVNLEKIKK